MNTPAHAVVNLALLGRGDHPETALPIVVGSILPDVPIVVFYAWAKLVRGVPEKVIWTRAYFDPDWQAGIDLFNSLPVILLALLLAWRLGAPPLDRSLRRHGPPRPRGAIPGTASMN